MFFYKNPWGKLPEILYEHGYKSELFHLPFKSHMSQNLDENIRLRACLQKKHELENSHIIIDALTYIELELALKELKHSTITIIDSTESHMSLDKTLIKTESSPLNKDIPTFRFYPSYSTFSFSYQMHQIWFGFLKQKTLKASCYFLNPPKSEYFKFIDHCVTLAELDFLDET
ncbi:MAG: hypothetical protein ACK41T_10305 [Pseudobdellovibrio sp.]